MKGKSGGASWKDKAATSKKIAESIQKLWKDPLYREKTIAATTGRKLTDEHRQNIIKALPRGPAHWAYKHDRSQLVKKQQRNDSAYKDWRKQVVNRDGWRCQISNNDCVKKIVVHHILTWAKFPELRYEVNNGITLCDFHHPRVRSEEVRLSPFFQSLVNSTNAK